MATLLLGDCANVLKHIETQSVDAIITSPPYADLKDYDGNGAGRIAPRDYPDWFLPIAREMARVIKPSGSIVIVWDDVFVEKFLDPYVMRTVIHVLDHTELQLAQRHYWVKPNARPDTTKRLKNCVENIFHFARNGYYADKDAVRVPAQYAKTDRREWKYNAGGADPSNVIYQKKTQEQATIHPALYPAEIPMRFVKYLTHVGDVVCDPFMGSGTTGVVALKLQRQFIGIELVPAHFDAAQKRIAAVEAQARLDLVI